MLDIRMFGNNCRLQMQEQNIDVKTFAEELGFSVLETERLLDGRLALYKNDIVDIASFFHLDQDEMFKDKGDAMYKGTGFLHCIGNFKNPVNKDLILDIFDQYCTLEECTV